MAKIPASIKLHVCLSPMLVKPETLGQSVVAVIDVLRASTTICTALYNGAQAVVPFADVMDAQSCFATLSAQEQTMVLLCGERNSVKPAGFHCGNSPLEYSRERVEGKTLFFTTTNGTRALAASRMARVQCVAGFVNAKAAADWMMRQAWNFHCDSITLICAGSDGDVNYEDTLCAGLLLELLSEAHTILPHRQQGSDIERTNYQSPMTEIFRSEAAQLAHEMYTLHQADQYQRVLIADHALALQDLGFGKDVAAALKINSLDVVPMMQDGTLMSE